MRGGRYKKILLSGEELRREAVELYPRVEALARSWIARQLTPAEAAALYILIYQRHRKPRMWLGGPHSNSFSFLGDQKQACLYDLNFLGPWSAGERRRLGQRPTALSVFEKFSVRAVPLSVNRALLSWAASFYPLTLTPEVPTPLEILEMQARGKRCVTMITNQTSMGKLILQQRDPLGFLLHDLIHADKFYQNKAILSGQIGFSRFIFQAWNQGRFEKLLKDKTFAHEFDYVASDMNSYCVHLLKCFKAVCLGGFLRLEGKAPNARLSTQGEREFHDFYVSLFEGVKATPDVITAALAVNGPDENQASISSALLHFFSQLKEINSFSFNRLHANERAEGDGERQAAL